MCTAAFGVGDPERDSGRKDARCLRNPSTSAAIVQSRAYSGERVAGVLNIIIRGLNATGMAIFSVAASWLFHRLFWNNAAWATLPENYPRKENMFNTLVIDMS